MLASSTLPGQELTTTSCKNLLYEIVVNIFANAEFKVVMGDYILVRFTTQCRMIETGLAPTVLIIWHCKNSPRELKSQPSMRTNQGGKGTIPPKKMRVAEVFSPPGFAYIPPDKSVASGAPIHQTYIDGFPTSAEEELDLVGLRGRYVVESRAFVADGERRVMSLIHLRRQ